jgi:DNA polymerase elongation subunit (family B)
MLQSCVGWILDVYLENDEAVLWIKTEDGKVLRLVDNYGPTFYIQPKSEQLGQEIIQILSGLPFVDEIDGQEKITSLVDNTKEKLIRVTTATVSHYDLLLKTLKHDKLRERINKTFNIDLSHLHRYIFESLNTRPSSRCSFQFENCSLISITEIENKQDNLPFCVLEAEIIPTTEQGNLDPDDPILLIRVEYQNDTITFEDNESIILQHFTGYVDSRDPDVIIFKNQDQNVLSYLLERTRSCSLQLKLGRREIDIYDHSRKYLLDKWTQGRIYVSEAQLNEVGIAGLAELSRFSRLPIRQVLRYSISKLIASRIHYELLKINCVIADNSKGSYEGIRSLEEIVDQDKAGMIFSPKIGLHENVAVLDFNDEFGSLIVRNNISFETVTKGVNDRIRMGVLPSIVSELISNRRYYRNLLNNLSPSNIEHEICTQRFNTLKKILVCLYGTTGSFWNKYGNVLAFEEINRESRKILLRQKISYRVNGLI